MATSTPRRRTPPVNAKLTQVKRANKSIWTGDAPAFATNRVDWFPGPLGDVADSKRITELVIPYPIRGPQGGPGPDPNYPPPPPYVPPTPLPGPGEWDEYEPPDDPPPPATPDPGSWRELALEAYGLRVYSTAFRAAYFGDNEAAPVESRSYPPYGEYSYFLPELQRWEYDVSAGGMHLTLGASDGLIDQTGNGRHANAAGGLLPGTRPGPPPGGESTYFDGVSSRVVTGFDPFREFGRLPPMPAGFWQYNPEGITGDPFDIWRPTRWSDPVVTESTSVDALFRFQQRPGFDDGYATALYESWADPVPFFEVGISKLDKDGDPFVIPVGMAGVGVVRVESDTDPDQWAEFAVGGSGVTDGANVWRMALNRTAVGTVPLSGTAGTVYRLTFTHPDYISTPGGEGLPASETAVAVGDDDLRDAFFADPAHHGWMFGYHEWFPNPSMIGGVPFDPSTWDDFHENWPNYGPPEKHVLISGWARRQDTTANHLLFSGTGPQSVQCWAAEGSNDVHLHLGPLAAVSTSTGASDHSSFRESNTGHWPNALPEDEWVHWAVEIVESPPAPESWLWGSRQRDPIRNPSSPFLPPVGFTSGVAWHTTRYYGTSPGAGAAGAPYAPSEDEGYAYGIYGLASTDFNEELRDLVPLVEADVWEHAGEPDAAYPYAAGHRRPWGDRIGAHAWARLFINGEEVAGDPQPTCPIGLNWPGLPLALDPDREPDPYPFKCGHVAPFYNIHLSAGVGSNPDARVCHRGGFVIGGRALDPTTADSGVDWTRTEYLCTNLDDYVASQEDVRSFKGDMAEVSIRRWDVHVVDFDARVRPWSYDWPDPSLAQLAAFEDAGPGLLTAGAPAQLSASTFAAVPIVDVTPAVGDTYTFTHAGRNYTRRITAIEYREDFGFLRLISDPA